MKSRLPAGALALVVSLASAFAGPRDAQWRQVRDAMSRGLPKTAIGQLDEILAGALADRAYPEAINALGRKIMLEGNIQGNKPEEKIVRLQAELAKAPAPMQPLLEAILADWYWQYFQENRWRFFQRTATAAPPGADLQTWDLGRILAEIDRHFSVALANDAALKSTRITEYDALLEPASVPDHYRPTLYDFLAQEALHFYQAGEHASTVVETEFEVAASDPIFAPAAEFVAWRPATTDLASPKLKAIRLYQSLLAFHRADPDRSAFYDVDLARLTYGHNVAAGDEKDDRYKAALERFIAGTRQHEISARALAALGAEFNREGDAVPAHAAAQRGFAAFPESAGGALCFNLLHEIETKSAQLETETVWNAPWPTLDLTYRNITKIYFRAVPVDFEQYGPLRQQGYSDYQDNVKRLLEAKPALQWAADLPATKDFKSRTEHLPTPTSLPPGFYLIIANYAPDFSGDDQQVSIAPVWVSNVALVLRLRNDTGQRGGFVLQAGSGEPVTGARVRIWERDRDGKFQAGTPAMTDENGWFEFSANDQPYVLLAEYRGNAVATSNVLYSYRGRERDERDSHTVFFTDRAIYRPGQTINYKGVAVRFDRTAGNYSVLAGRELTVVFNDPNGKEIARATHRTNDYGSFSGVFTAPRDRLTGRMTLQILGRESQTAINVEEYKRPKFRVELNPPVAAARLDAAVDVDGHATAYTGAAIGGAKVAWRVERAVRLPYWCWWWQPPTNKAIAHGTAVTAPDGTFKVHFVAVPDRTVPAKNEPVFVYTVHADVTDPTGETRSEDRSVRAGYTALQASVKADAWQTPDKPVKFTLATKSLDDDSQPAKGTLTIHELTQPNQLERARLQRRPYWFDRAPGEPKPDPANPDSWELGRRIVTQTFAIDATGATHATALLRPGIYRAILETKDRFGNKVTARQTVEVDDPQDRHYHIKLANHFATSKTSVEPGETAQIVWGTGYVSGRAFVEVECNGERFASYWTQPTQTQELIEVPVTEQMRGGFAVRVTYIRENRAYLNERIVDVPWSNKKLSVKWEHFRSKLTPGAKETWTAVVTGPDAKPHVAEMVATLYDASLDQFTPHPWPTAFGLFRQEFPRGSTTLLNHIINFRDIAHWDGPESREPNWHYREFPPAITGHGGAWSYPVISGGADTVTLSAFTVSANRPGNATAMMAANTTLAGTMVSAAVLSPAAEKPDLSKVVARKNLTETAFFFPRLLSDRSGAIKMEFTSPEALTQWRFLGLAHDRDLRAGFLTALAVTSKDLMVEPNAPRFVREGDAIDFTVKVSNQTDQPQTGSVKLTFADAATLQSSDDALGNRAPEQPFTIPAHQARIYSWRITVPDGLGFLTYKAVASSAQSSDGEENFLPVLGRRVLVTESLPLPIRGRSTREFTFPKLLASGSSDTLRHQSLTVQMTSQPAWYAVMALPYLMEFPHECSEQVFNRLYANALARHIANSDPKIRRIFDLWKNTPALDSPLEKNQDLKSVLIEETPWVRAAKAESEARRNVGLLFDATRLDEELARTHRTLSEQQLGGGLWPWFPGGLPNEYISLYIMTGFGRLRHLGVDLDVQPAVRALAALDAWMNDRWQRILDRPNPGQYVPGYIDALYLYGRSFFLADRPIGAPHRAAVDFFLSQSRKYWLQMDSRQSQAHLALALQRFGDKETPPAILKSIKERSVSHEELGMFWRDAEFSWWWYHAPIETQALMIEAFGEIDNDSAAVDNCRIWLLKQKQTQAWPTTKSTADAVYALLVPRRSGFTPDTATAPRRSGITPDTATAPRRSGFTPDTPVVGSGLLSSDALVEVSLGGQPIKPEHVEAGTGFYEKKFTHAEITPAMGRVIVKKTDDGVSWGSVHWQYLEDIAKVTPHEGTPLTLKKALFVKETTSRGPVLKPVTGPLSVGDELIVRIELRSDRDMEFVHLKDQRGSGTEPVNVLSRYKYQDGLAYYEATRDTASHFFIDYLPKGTYVFEYSTRVQLKGRYQTGVASIECMYAPEFNSHSESIALEVK